MLYPKIQSMFKRTPKGQIVWGDWSTPELEYLHDKPWDWSEKIDGTNIRMWVEDGRLVVGGRTANVQIPAPLIQWLYANIGVAALEALGDGAMLFGEGFGGKIQKGGATYGPQQRFVLFDVVCGGFWLRRSDVADVAEQVGVGSVQEVFQGTIGEALRVVSTEDWQSAYGTFLPEGLVGRPAVPLFDRAGRAIMVKVKAKDLKATGRMGERWTLES